MNRRERRATQAKTRAEGTDKRLSGMETRHGGRTVELRIYINTGRDLPALTAMVRELQSSTVIRGPAKDQILIALSEVDPVDAASLWSETYTAVEQTVKSQN